MTLSQDSPSVSALNPMRSHKVSVPEAGHSRFFPLGRDLDPIRLPGMSCPIKPNVPLSTLTSFRVGGPAELYVAPNNFEDLQTSLDWAAVRGLPITLLGAGSNLLISDRGLPGLVISTCHLQQTSFDPQTGRVTAGAGKSIPRLAWQAAKMGWSGLEWAVGIPGTVGGAVVMNAGAHQSCTAEILVEAQVLSIGGAVKLWTPDDFHYSYRTSALQGSTRHSPAQAARLVAQATFQLEPGHDVAEVMATTTHHRDQRLVSQPYHLPSCGSVFRNPTPYKAGWLIEQTGLKGYQIGGAQVAHRHANFILNCGGATASDIFQLIHLVQQQVEQNWSLLLEPEVKILGEFQAA